MYGYWRLSGKFFFFFFLSPGTDEVDKVRSRTLCLCVALYKCLDLFQAVQRIPLIRLADLTTVYTERDYLLQNWKTMLRVSSQANEED